VGRLATYKYYNMDQVVGQALATASKLIDAPVPLQLEREPVARQGHPMLNGKTTQVE